MLNCGKHDKSVDVFGIGAVVKVTRCLMSCIVALYCSFFGAVFGAIESLMQYLVADVFVIPRWISVNSSLKTMSRPRALRHETPSGRYCYPPETIGEAVHVATAPPTSHAHLITPSRFSIGCGPE